MTDALIRSARDGDVDGMLAIYAPIVTDTAISFEEHPPDAAEFVRRVRAIRQRHAWLVCVADGDVLGYAYASTFHPRAAYQWTVEATVYVSASARRRGVGRALYTSLFECLKLQGCQTAVALIALPNAGSVGLHEAMGFAPTGVLPRAGYKHGAWHDVGYWSLALGDTHQPAAPLLPEELADDPRWERAVGTGQALLLQ